MLHQPRDAISIIFRASASSICIFLAPTKKPDPAKAFFLFYRLLVHFYKRTIGHCYRYKTPYNGHCYRYKTPYNRGAGLKRESFSTRPPWITTKRANMARYT
jgi:hypothetical protein